MKLGSSSNGTRLERLERSLDDGERLFRELTELDRVEQFKTAILNLFVELIRKGEAKA